MKNGLHIWNQHGKICKLRNSEKFWTRSWSPRGQKTAKSALSATFFATQEVVLGESTFGGENELQIRKIKLFQKLDRQGFPTSQLTLDLDTKNASKTLLEMALRIKILMLCIKLILSVLP